MSISSILERTPLARDTKMEIVTEKIPNVIGTNNQMRFQIPQKAILDGGSKILMTLTCSNLWNIVTGQNDTIRLNATTGGAVTLDITIPAGTYTTTALLVAMNLVGNRALSAPLGTYAVGDITFQFNATTKVLTITNNDADVTEVYDTNAPTYPAGGLFQQRYWATTQPDGTAIGDIAGAAGTKTLIMSVPEDNYYLPTATGVMSLIRRASIVTSTGVTISDSVFFNQKSVSEQQFAEGYKRKNTDTYKYGVNAFWEVGNQPSNANENKCVVGNGVKGTDGTNMTPNSVTKLSNDSSKSPTFLLPLDSLFSYMYQNQLPMGLINEAVYIDLEFEEEVNLGDRVVNLLDPNALASSPISVRDCYLYCDFLVYDSGAMGEIRERMGRNGLNQVYDDYICNIVNIPRTAAAVNTGVDGTIQTNRFIGGSNHAVKGICCSQLDLDDTGANVYLPQTLGKYYSSSNVSQQTWNYRINNQNIFIDNDREWTELYQQTKEYYGIAPYVPKWVYGNDAPQPTALNFLPASAHLCSDPNNAPLGSANVSMYIGKLGSYCLNLQDMKGRYYEVEDTPINVEVKRVEFDNANSDKTLQNGLLQHYFITYRRGLIIDKDGQMVVSERIM